MLRLDPAHPPAWRDESALQFGLEPVLVIADPQPWQEVVVHVLGPGATRSDAVSIAIAHGASAGAARAFLDRLRPVLLEERARGRIHLDVAPNLPHPVGADAAGLLSAAFDLAPSPERGAPVLLIAAHLVHPAQARAVARDGLAHLPVVFAGDRATIGPLLIPGDGPCLDCANAHRRAADPAWPVVAAQLLSRRAEPVPAAFLAETLGVAERFLSGSAGPRARTHAMTISARELRRTWAERSVHPECGCRSLAGTAIAGASNVRSFPPTRARAYARPA